MSNTQILIGASLVVPVNEQEKQRRDELERLGEQLVSENVKDGAIYNDERKRQAAFRWLGKQAQRSRKARKRYLLVRKVDVLCRGDRRGAWSRGHGGSAASLERADSAG